MIVTAQHRVALTALQLRVLNTTGATKRAAEAVSKAATAAENAALVASEVVAKATREAEELASEQVAVVKAAVLKARLEIAAAAEVEITAAKEAEAALTALNEDIGRIKHLEGLLSICMTCKKIRTKSNDWDQLEKYIGEHSSAVFSHGMCPECLHEKVKELDRKVAPGIKTIMQ